MATCMENTPVGVMARHLPRFHGVTTLDAVRRAGQMQIFVTLRGACALTERKRPVGRLGECNLWDMGGCSGSTGEGEDEDSGPR